MPTDIRLEDNDVVVEGSALRVSGADIKLDNAARRSKKAETVPRRALVHDFNDGLTINWASDYPGGVTVNGTKSLAGYNNKSLLEIESRLVKVIGTDLLLDSPGRRKETAKPYRRALVHDYTDGLTINWASDYPGGVTLNGNVTVPTKLTVAGKDVAALLTSMEAEIATLKAKVAALEKKVG